MAIRPSGMTDVEIQELLAEVGRGTIQARTAIALMVAKGEVHAEAARMVFHALGGSDHTELGADGRPRYVGSGKLVADIERSIAAGLDGSDVVPAPRVPNRREVGGSEQSPESPKH